MRGNKYISSTETSGSHSGKKSDLMTNSLTRIFCDGETKNLSVCWVKRGERFWVSNPEEDVSSSWVHMCLNTR